MRQIFALAALFVGILLPAASVGAQPQDPTPATLIQNVRTLDVEAGELVGPVSILVADGKVTRIAATISSVPDDATVIDGMGHVAIPGVITAGGEPYPGSIGIVREGEPADLLVFAGDPIEDPSILTRADEGLVLVMRHGEVTLNRLAGGAADTSSQALQIPDSQLRDAQTLTGDDLVADDFPGSWPMFGTNLRMKVGGYVKADFVYDLDGTLDKTQFLMSTIPVPGMPEYGDSGYVAFFARESRFSIDVRRTAGPVPLKMFLETDFWTAGNQLRLRHAYMVAGDFVIGQTWTTLSFLESLPFLVDFAAGDALLGGRTAQVRYQKEVNDHISFAVGIENLDFQGIENPEGLPGEARSQLPLLALRGGYRWNTGVLLVGGSAGQLRWEGGSQAPSPTALQITAVVAGRQYLGEKNFFTWNVTYGKGSGENIMAFIGSDANAVLTEDGRLETIPAFAAVVGFVRDWNDSLTTNFSYAYGWLEAPESRAPLALKRGGVGHVNLIWRPVPHFSTGVEYMWGAQRVTNDSLGKAGRFQLMAKFAF